MLHNWRVQTGGQAITWAVGDGAASTLRFRDEHLMTSCFEAAS